VRLVLGSNLSWNTGHLNDFLHFRQPVQENDWIKTQLDKDFFSEVVSSSSAILPVPSMQS
jgi:hypothetical protein